MMAEAKEGAGGSHGRDAQGQEGMCVYVCVCIYIFEIYTYFIYIFENHTEGENTGEDWSSLDTGQSVRSLFQESR